MINIAALASGSNGNSYFFEDDVDSLLVDVGVSCKQIVQRMDNLNLKMNRLGGIFITHEHSDHIRGLEVLAKNFEIPMYMTKGTYENSKVKLNDRLYEYLVMVEKSSIQTYSQIVLIGSEIHIYKLDKSELTNIKKNFQTAYSASMYYFALVSKMVSSNDMSEIDIAWTGSQMQIEEMLKYKKEATAGLLVINKYLQ